MDLSRFRYENSNLYNSKGDAVMMEWEREWMKKSAEIVCRNGGDILNIGHGLGLVDSYIQEHNPKSHTIIEIHPQVHEYMEQNGWNIKAKIIKSDWRKVIDTLPTFDGIYFDTWANRWDDFENGILNKLKYILKKNGIFSYWYNSDKESDELKKICDRNNLDLYYEKMNINIPKIQHKRGKTYINPDLKSIFLPIIVNRNEPMTFKKTVI
jgi:hypothetical protein